VEQQIKRSEPGLRQTLTHLITKYDGSTAFPYKISSAVLLEYREDNLLLSWTFRLYHIHCWEVNVSTRVHRDLSKSLSSSIGKAEPAFLHFFSKENLTGKPKGRFPTFVNDIFGKPISVDLCASPKGIQNMHLLAWN